jgi:hypothetical protein
VRSPQVRSPQVRSPQVRSPQVRSPQVWSNSGVAMPELIAAPAKTNAAIEPSAVRQ